MNFLRREESVDEAQLNSASQQKMASLVKAMHEDELSLSWRSDLNAKLAAAQQAKAKRTRLNIYAWGSSLSVGVAATFFGVMFFNSPTPKSQPMVAESPSLASELMKEHQESMVLASVSATGSAARETSFIDDSYGLQDELL